ncbi:hypothetical protein B0J17DRAFT_221427 [Rhizoctonia solani]|nr:hypothetical protein B0J17DRAFT_221427 [Rhizoctonia solani]
MTHMLSETFSSILNCLDMQGAKIGRCKSLLVRTGRINAIKLSCLIDCIGRSPATSLQRLRFDYCRQMESKRTFPYNENYSRGWTSEAPVLLGSLLASLCCLELVLPYAYTFGSIWTFTKLKELIIVSHKLNPTELSNLLLSNPQLESLCLGDGNKSLNPFQGLEIDPHPVPSRGTNAPSLRSLPIHASVDSAWALYMLATIKADKLQSFALKCFPKKFTDIHGYSESIDVHKLGRWTDRSYHPPAKSLLWDRAGSFAQRPLNAQSTPNIESDTRSENSIMHIHTGINP